MRIDPTHKAPTHRLAWAALLWLPWASHAAGFDCTKAASDAEKTVCADATLSRLDSNLSKAWQQALTGGDATAMKAAQRDWLKRRDACAQDRACLADQYRQRLAILQQAPAGSAQRWQQAWALDINSATAGGELVFAGTPPKLHFSLTANNGGNEGSIDGDIVVHGDHASFREGSCQLDFQHRGQRIELAQQGQDADCGAGMGVYYSGNYIPASQFAAKAKPDLLNVKVLADAQQDRAARALLGPDYQTLVDTINVWSEADDQDGLGAKVIDGFVRGLANTNAFILMSEGDQLWIGLLAFDARSQLHTRYYSNVPHWKHRLPKTIQAWHDSIDGAPPIEITP